MKSKIRSSKTEYEYRTIQMTWSNHFRKSIPNWTEETINNMASQGWELVQQSSVGGGLATAYPLLTFRRAKK